MSRVPKLLFEPPELAKIAGAADKQGTIVHAHAIGDQAVTEALSEKIKLARSFGGLKCQAASQPSDWLRA